MNFGRHPVGAQRWRLALLIAMNGEFIVRADQTAKYLDVLNAINSGQNLRVPNVGNSISVAAPVQTSAPVIQITTGSDSKQSNAELADAIERRLRDHDTFST